jgi:hypothetical protein
MMVGRIFAYMIKIVSYAECAEINLLQQEYCADMKCRLCDEHDVRYPNTDTTQPLITTYVREARQCAPSYASGLPVSFV